MTPRPSDIAAAEKLAENRETFLLALDWQEVKTGKPIEVPSWIKSELKLAFLEGIAHARADLMSEAEEWCNRPAMHFGKSSSSQPQHDYVDGARALLKHLQRIQPPQGKEE